ncbi:hypothetical protein DL98DRAFT_218876 [Cadophora sp. DSE1049]|nr:hypothetical protein DL98DRAFT_218876 [Cadophora sp. DSE1049]
MPIPSAISKLYSTCPRNDTDEIKADTSEVSTKVSPLSASPTMLQPFAAINNSRFGIEHVLAIVFGVTGLATASYAIWQNRRQVYDTASHWCAEGMLDNCLACNFN